MLYKVNVPEIKILNCINTRFTVFSFYSNESVWISCFYFEGDPTIFPVVLFFWPVSSLVLLVATFSVCTQTCQRMQELGWHQHEDTLERDWLGFVLQETAAGWRCVKM